ncbi:unnamed protein product [Caenorhabditis auriculariae]|uniref:ZP domain-containing protein n=1 Tax=Caenorhabditis auriculariae TaxID=2777116 RepID=A0A8S1HQ84_9PELO|nr:unnamed protein product [Caenorhabditis auriculariae]
MCRWLWLAVWLKLCQAIPVDNNVESEPEIECGSTSITVNFNTRNPFDGHVFVKGLYDQDECRSDLQGRQVAGIELPFDSCNTARTRSLNPKGVFVSTTVVISFHPQFVTKVDRAYRIQCFYMESDKTVSTQIEVSDLTTVFQTQIVPMPICRYEILDGGPTGRPTQFATIGQQVYHKWTCDSETTDTFCAVVHSCTVDDGNGDVVQILSDTGCALDKFLLNNLEYPTDLMAGQEAHVYKFADRAQLFYQCQISITVKEPNGECPRPTCAEPQGFGAIQTRGEARSLNSTSSAPTRTATIPPSFQRFLLRRRRSLNFEEHVLDVRTELNAVESFQEKTSTPLRLMSALSTSSFICMRPLTATFLGAFLIAGFLISSIKAQKNQLWAVASYEKVAKRWRRRERERQKLMTHISMLGGPSWIVVATAFVALVRAIPVDNNVEGEPEVECGPNSITVNFNTRNPFEGHVYVKGLYDQEGCRSDDGGRQVAGIELPFDSCNTARTRSLNPKGVFVSTTVVISFHPQFVTKVDRAYRIQCFYMESDKTVSTQIEVSDLTTAFQTQVVPMPVCKYEILDGGPSGQPIQFATIGQQVYHKWTCDSETTDTFCAVVHSCTVDDGNGDTVQILNEEGCALDKFLLNNLEYPTDLMAGQEAHVYKYADRSQLFYQCQISITIKDPGSECPRPTCSEPQGFGAVKQGGGGGGAAPAAAAPAATAAAPRAQLAQLRLLRKKRQALNENVLDVRVELSALDIVEGSDSSAQAAALSTSGVSSDGISRGICLSPLGFASFLGIGTAVATALSAMLFYTARPAHYKA